MKPLGSLSAEDSRHVKAAERWLELGNHSEANEELEKVEAANRAHPEVLFLRWEIYARARQWKACEDIASRFVLLRNIETRNGFRTRSFTAGLATDATLL